MVWTFSEKTEFTEYTTAQEAYDGSSTARKMFY